MVALIKPDNQIAQPQKSNEWYTPSKYIEAAREVMGGIDLDPASCELANQTVKAKRFYSKEDNGLTKPWYGRVWLNPPFSREGYRLPQFVWGTKLHDEYRQGHIEQAVLLLMTTAKNTWFHNLWEMLDCSMCIARKRLHFSLPSGETIELKDGIFFAYLGSNEQRFAEVFSGLGTVVKRVSPPRQEVAPIQLWEVR